MFRAIRFQPEMAAGANKTDAMPRQPFGQYVNGVENERSDSSVGGRYAPQSVCV